MIQQDELIQRWQNVHRVLDAMPEHEREKHWDMAVWGKKTACGTIACAAGHCGLDPWFRERGFKLDFHDDDSDISDVTTFFGIEGSSRIFLNSRPRPVEAVIQEVSGYTDELLRMAHVMAASQAPNVGEHWPVQGGICAGARLGVDGAPDYILIVGPEYDGQLTWNAANEWAAALSIDGHGDFTLPLRIEQHALFDRTRSLFQETYYWSGEQRASGSGGAWFQGFADGFQGGWGKGGELRARAVRRLIIQ